MVRVWAVLQVRNFGEMFVLCGEICVTKFAGVQNEILAKAKDYRNSNGLPLVQCPITAPRAVP